MPTPYSGSVTSYDMAVGVKVNMDELIYMNSPMDCPLILGVDAQSNMVIAKDTVDQIRFDWMNEDTLNPRVAVAALATTAETSITVTTGEARRFQSGDVARIFFSSSANTELIRITGVTTSALTVTRGYASSTNRSIVTGDMIVGVGLALAEGSAAPAARVRDRTIVSNYTQIHMQKVDMTGTEQVVSRYGVSDEWAKQLFLRQRELYIGIDQAALYGVTSNDASTKIRTTGGLYERLTSNVDSTSTQLTVAAVAARQLACYQQGDVPSVLIANPASLGDLNEIADTNRVRVTEVDSRRGRVRVEVIDTEFGTTTIIRDRWCHPYNAFLVKPSAITRRILRPTQYVPLAVTSDSNQAHVVCEEGFEIKGEVHMAKFTGLTSYTAA